MSSLWQSSCSPERPYQHVCRRCIFLLLVEAPNNFQIGIVGAYVNPSGLVCDLVTFSSTTDLELVSAPTAEVSSPIDIYICVCVRVYVCVLINTL